MSIHAKHTLLYCRIWSVFILTILFAQQIQAQASPVSQGNNKIRGYIFDRGSDLALANAEIELLNISPQKLSRTDESGNFQIEAIPIGRHRIMVTYEGYEPVIVPDIVVSAGNHLFLKIGLDEIQKKPNVVAEEKKKAKALAAITKTTKDKPNNQMAGISARPFTVEEVTRFAGARFDPARMVTNYAGAAGYDDSRNDIVVRGNSPAHVLWQIEELPIENPNHVSTIGTTGGVTPILNVFALGQADFLTGAFAAQYGNTTAGVFDLKLRSGSDDRFGGIGQLGTQRAEILLEGPISKKLKGSSFLLSMRASSGYYLLHNYIPSDPEHQDFNLKIDLGRQKWGELEFFAIGGRSLVAMPYEENTYPDSNNAFLVNFRDRAFYNKVRYDIFEYEDYRHLTLMGFAGIKYTAHLGKRSFWRTIVGASHHSTNASWILNEEDSLGTVVEQFDSYIIKDYRNNYMINSYLQSKINRNIMLRGGFLGNIYHLSLYENFLLDEVLDYDFNGVFALLQGYLQTKIHIGKSLTMNAGLNAQYLSLNKQLVIDPRVALNWEFIAGHTLSAGYGLHHQMIPYFVLFFQPILPDGSYYKEHPNTLKFISSHHLSVAYDWLIGQNTRLRIEGYMQLLGNIPVEQDSSAYSSINQGATFYDAYSDVLRSTGRAQNKGIELTLEKFFSKNFYGLVSGSLFNSKYQGSDGIWRNTIYNNKYIINVLTGKEFPFGENKQNAAFVDLRFSTTAGKPYTPIDTLETFLQGNEAEIYFENLRNAKTLRNFYQVDLKVGFRVVGNKLTHSFKIDLFNVLNIKNPLTVRYSERFNPLGLVVQGREQIIYQRGFIPDITYTIQF